MELDQVMALVDALEKTGWKSFEVEQNGFHLKLERDMQGGSVLLPKAPVAPPVQGEAPTPQVDTSAVDAEPPGKEITSPLVGVFHPLPGDKQVKAGDVLKKGEPFCLIEAMKLMNEVTMPEDGEITYLALQEGDTVEFGQLIAKYK